MASLKSVNLKSGNGLRSFALDAVFLYCPSALLVSQTSLPCKRDDYTSIPHSLQSKLTLKLNALAMASATSKIVTSAASSTLRIIGSTLS